MPVHELPFDVMKCTRLVHGLERLVDGDDPTVVVRFIEHIGLSQRDLRALDEEPQHFPCFGRGYRVMRWYDRLRRVLDDPTLNIYARLPEQASAD